MLDLKSRDRDLKSEIYVACVAEQQRHLTVNQADGVVLRRCESYHMHQHCRLPIADLNAGVLKSAIGNWKSAIDLVHVVGLAPTKDHQVRLIYSQEPLLLGITHARSNCRFQIRDPFVLKNR